MHIHIYVHTFVSCRRLALHLLYPLVDVVGAVPEDISDEEWGALCEEAKRVVKAIAAIYGMYLCMHTHACVYVYE
jgi:hypothetical protein